MKGMPEIQPLQKLCYENQIFVAPATTSRHLFLLSANSLLFTFTKPVLKLSPSTPF
jgi:hypothetical protein